MIKLLMRLSQLYLGVLCILVILGGSVFAQTADQTDCSDLGRVDVDTYPTSVVKSMQDKGIKHSLKIYTDTDMKIALTHLKQYCCSSSRLSSETCKSVQTSGKKHFPESPYIFDHLMYVGMKKLDGNEEHCATLGIDCTLRDYDADPVGWREEIQAISQDTKGYPPSLILEKRKLYWGSLDDINDDSKSTLKKAQNALCQDAIEIRNAVGNNQGISDALVADGKSLSVLCQEVTYNRYSMESSYVRTLQVEKGTKYFVDNLKAYLSTYFVENRLSDLMGKYSALNSCFSMVLKYVSKTSCCNY